MISGLHHLIQNELKLNQPGAAGWLTRDAFWLVSKTVTDKLRAYLQSQAIEGIPSSNIAVFDELQSHGLIESNPKAKPSGPHSSHRETGSRPLPFCVFNRC